MVKRADCVVCGADLPPRRQKYCSDECKAAAHGQPQESAGTGAPMEPVPEPGPVGGDAPGPQPAPHYPPENEGEAIAAQFDNPEVTRARITRMRKWGKTWLDIADELKITPDAARRIYQGEP